MKSAVLAASAFLAAAAVAAPAPAEAAAQLPFSIQAPRDAVYDLRCRFRAVRIDNLLVNNINLSGRGPRTGRLPTDNARCTLKHLRGPGPVSLTVTKGKPQTVRVAGPGQQQMLAVF